ncbi:sigma-70 family RNA polymerase sigma factor [bacterium]|nr:sigma-70 family RNA polymerase sigma factor [candidate division CSSED10-310 bacterium]
MPAGDQPHLERDGTMPISDDDLMCRFQQGDESGFLRLLERYQDRILNFIFRMINDRQLAEDLTQEVFVRIYMNAGRYHPGSRFAPWLYRIASNLAINELRRRKRWRFVTIDSHPADDDRMVITDLEDEDSISPDQHVEQKEAAEEVAEALERIPVKYRAPLILRELEGYDYEEIAQILDVPRGTVKSRLNRGRSLLVTALQRARATASAALG